MLLCVIAIFYNQFYPLFEVKVKLLRALYTQHLRKNISLKAWTSNMKGVCDVLRIDITSSPVIVPHDKKLCFLKTDRRRWDMSFILKQPDDSIEYFKALQSFIPYLENNFDMDMNGAYLQPMSYRHTIIQMIHHTKITCNRGLWGPLVLLFLVRCAWTFY